MSEITPELQNVFLQIITYKITLRQRNIRITNVHHLPYFGEELRGVEVPTEERTETEKEENP